MFRLSGTESLVADGVDVQKEAPSCAETAPIARQYVKAGLM